jgi:hypothetical protein
LQSYRAYKNPPKVTKHIIEKSVISLYESLKNRLVDKLSGEEISLVLALDGWTNIRKNKVTNIALLNPRDSHSYYWSSKN